MLKAIACKCSHQCRLRSATDLLLSIFQAHHDDAANVMHGLFQQYVVVPTLAIAKVRRMLPHNRTILLMVMTWSSL